MFTEATGTPIDALTGGLMLNTVTLIYGPTGCGKTTLLLKISENFLSKGFNVYYIDTEGGVGRGVGRINVKQAPSLKDQAKILRDVAEEVSGSKKSLIIVDTITGHFHRQVLGALREYRASVAGDLSGKLVAQLNILRNCVRDAGLAVVTAHLKSPVSDNFRMNVLRKIAKAWREGKYTPTATDYERYMAWDPVRWVGGQGLGMHTQFRFRIYVDEDKSRILQVEKWPLLPNWCVRYVIDSSGEFKMLGDKFLMDKHTMIRLYSLEFKTILGEVLEIGEKEGIEVEVEEHPRGAEKGESKKAASKTGKAGELKLPKVKSLGEIIEEEKRGGSGEPSNTGPGGEGSSRRQSEG